MVGPSTCRTRGWRQALADAATEAGVDPALAASQTDAADEMEGLYLKVEEGGRVVERYKWVRAGFHQSILDSDSHWADRPIIANRMADQQVSRLPVVDRDDPGRIRGLVTLVDLLAGRRKDIHEERHAERIFRVRLRPAQWTASPAELP